jgi:hypothetical protein
MKRSICALLATGTNANAVGVGFTDLGYADQLHAALAAVDPKLELVKLGCTGESTVSLWFGSQLPSVAGSCGTPSDERHSGRRRQGRELGRHQRVLQGDGGHPSQGRSAPTRRHDQPWSLL